MIIQEKTSGRISRSAFLLFAAVLFTYMGPAVASESTAAEKARSHFERAYADCVEGSEEADAEFSKAFKLDPSGESALGLFAKMEWFADGIGGLTANYPRGQHSEFTLFHELSTYAKSMDSRVIEKHLQNASSAGKMYLIAIMKIFDSGRANQILEGLICSDTPVKYLRGCCSEMITEADIAKRLLVPECLPRFRASKGFFPIDDVMAFADRRKCVENFPEISHAKEFKSITWSPGFGQGERLPREFSNFIPQTVLQDALRSASPAGRLFIAAILQKYFPADGETVLKQLSSDKSTVIYSEGATKEECCVADIAQALLKDSKFRKFSLDYPRVGRVHLQGYDND